MVGRFESVELKRGALAHEDGGFVGADAVSGGVVAQARPLLSCD